jgi:hypothetical protein
MALLIMRSVPMDHVDCTRGKGGAAAAGAAAAAAHADMDVSRFTRKRERDDDDAAEKVGWARVRGIVACLHGDVGGVYVSVSGVLRSVCPCVLQKKPAPMSAGQRKLAKTDTKGMKSMAFFFGKKPA